MVGRPSPRSPSISRLTLPPETIPSCYRRTRHTEFQPHSGRHPARIPLAFPLIAIPSARLGHSRRYSSFRLPWDPRARETQPVLLPGAAGSGRSETARTHPRAPICPGSVKRLCCRQEITIRPQRHDKERS
jgi:hypothetical protein